MTEGRRDAQNDITRRQALKRVAAAGAVAWAVPTIQTLNMRSAWAQGASPITVCYRIKTNGLANCDEGFGAQDCLDPQSNFTGETLDTCPNNAPGCCDFYVSTTIVSTCIWTVTVDPGCTIIGATAKTGGNPHTETVCFEFPGSGTNSITVNTCSLTTNGISHVELAICCGQAQSAQSSNQATSGTDSGSGTRPGG